MCYRSSAQHRHAADNGCAADGIQPTALLEIYFLGFRVPDPPLPLMPNVGQPRFSQKSAPTKGNSLITWAKYWGCGYLLIA